MRINRRLLSYTVNTLVVLLAVVCLFAYVMTPLQARIILLVAFFGYFALLVIAVTNRFNEKNVFFILIAIELFFALWRNNFLTPSFVEFQSNYQQATNSLTIIQTGQLGFGDPHSYFFLSSMLDSFLNLFGGLSIASVVYVTFAIDVIFTASVSVLILYLVYKKAQSVFPKSILCAIIPSSLAILTIAFANSVRGGYAFVMVPLLLWLTFDPRFRVRTAIILVTLFTFAVTWGSTVGAFFLIPFFFVAAILTTKNRLFFSFIPLSYMLFAAYSYTLTIKGYIVSSWDGFVTYFRDLFAGSFVSRTLPWTRAPAGSVGDSYVISIAYVSFLLLAGITAIVLTFSKDKTKKETSNLRKHTDPLLKAALVCTWLFLCIASITYLGSVSAQEGPSSDIRTIAIIFISFSLPFLFTSEKLLKKINSKTIGGMLTVLILLASLGPLYQVSLKSANDPIVAVEDSRLEPFSKYYAGDFLAKFVNQTVPPVVLSDYKNALYLAPILEPKVNMVEFYGSNFPPIVPNLILFDNNGLRYGSIYVSPKLYESVSSLMQNQSVIYSSGNETILFISNNFP